MVYFKSLDEAVTYAKKCYLETGYTGWYDNEKKMYYVIGKQRGDNHETTEKSCAGH